MENSREPQPSGAIIRLLAWGGIIGPILFVAAFTIAGALRPGYSPISQAISALGTGPDGWQEDIPAIILGLLLLAFTVSFFLAMRTVLPTTSRIIGTILLAIFSLVWITVGVFTAAPSTRTVHTIVSVIGEIAAITALFVIGVGLRAAPAWRAWSIYTIVTAVVALVTLLLTFITSQRSISASLRIGGLLERLLVVEILAWLVAFGVKLARGEAPASPSPTPLYPTEQGGVR
jgi:hypothetical membrane protein